MTVKRVKGASPLVSHPVIMKYCYLCFKVQIYKGTPRKSIGRRVLSLFLQEDAMSIYMEAADLCAHF